MTYLWHELTNKRTEERTISYVECHDQALVGGKTMIFELIDSAMYDAMHVCQENLQVDRGMALHKMMRLATFATAGHGYLNFMGNEFGHPEWIDFPREGNNWSFHYARRQWHLRDEQDLRFHFLADFDRDMLTRIDSTHFTEGPASLAYIHEDHHVLAFERGGIHFFFNFHPSRSFVDYEIPLPAGKYALLLDTDATAYGGHGRIAPGQTYFTTTGTDADRPMGQFYLPSRSAFVIVPE
jgi:1,4-alpha-glucan branching enzyme